MLNQGAVATPTLLVTARPAYEFILSLVALATPGRVDSYDVGSDWFERVRALGGPQLISQLEALTRGCEHVLCRLYGMAHDLEPPASAEALVAAVEKLDPATLRLTLLGYYAKRTRRRVPPDVILAAARGDPAAQRQLLADAPDGPECERALAATLACEPVQLQRLAQEVLGGWREAAWEQVSSQAWPAIEREVDRLRSVATETPVERLLQSVTGGAEVLPGPGIELIELFPTWVLRPWTIQWEHGPTLLLGVPVPAEQLGADPDEPPERLVGLARALGDERRLRILRRLTAGDYSLQDLSEYFAIPKTTLLHHLVMLRSVGIVRVGASGRYSLNAAMPLELLRLLDRYLPAVATNGGRHRPRLD
ncbi:MAG TPA: helix-turn-helix domain-containing protein [Candidatus Limnocylindria bacterium]|nr:helix-turn-helix domain-containing protein [Candidatus Limnocylindria bacterium]